MTEVEALPPCPKCGASAWLFVLSGGDLRSAACKQCAYVETFAAR